jgi:crotonobetainyl-CoA:carnitine CoA-transferase CaiB-like acyl-CoA transferase
MAGVFESLVVLDLSSGIAGPMTSMLLADGGADVVRIEPPGGHRLGTQSGSRVWNRGKRSAILDLRSPDDRNTFRALAATADVVLDSFLPSECRRLGLDLDELRAANPRLVTCSISAYGDHPRHRDRPGLDALVAARTGLLHDHRGRRGTAMEYICGRPGPLPDLDAPEGLRRGAHRPGPLFPRTPWPSIGAAYLSSLGVTAALRAREVIGTGQHVETSLMAGALAAACLNWQRVEDPDAPLYWMWPTDARSIEGLFECADGRWVHHWTVRPAWVLRAAEGDVLDPAPLDEAYRDDPDRISMEPDGMLTGTFVYPLLADAFAKFPSADWLAAGEAAGMGVSLVRSPAEALADPSFLADGCVVQVDDPDIGPIRHLGPVLELSATPSAVRGRAPRPGEHTEEVIFRAAVANVGRPANGPVAPEPTALAHPLDGIRVLDLGLGVAGPFTGRMLADLGADVVKIHALHDGYWSGTHMGLGTNRGKRSIALNLKDPGGRAVLDRLLESADVLTTNWRPGAAARLGLDDETLRHRFPRLIHCNTRGYERGPRSELPGTDQSSAALTGPEWEDGAVDAGNPPLWSRSSMGDTGNALLAAIAITAALYHRERTGEGQAVSTSIVNAGLLHSSYAWIDADGRGTDWGHVDGDQFGMGALYRLYACANDSWLFLAAFDPEHRKRLADVIGDRAILDADDPELASNLAARFAEGAASDWWERLDRAGIPVEVVDESFCRDLFDDPDARRLGLVAETWAGAVGRFEDPGLLVGFSATPGLVQRGPCMCGEHTRELLRELGYADAEIDALAEAKAVLDAPVVPS